MQFDECDITTDCGSDLFGSFWKNVIVRNFICPQAEFMARADFWRPGIAPSGFSSGQDATGVQLLSYITKYMAKATFPNRKQINSMRRLVDFRRSEYLRVNFQMWYEMVRVKRWITLITANYCTSVQ